MYSLLKNAILEVLVEGAACELEHNFYMVKLNGPCLLCPGLFH